MTASPSRRTFVAAGLSVAGGLSIGVGLPGIATAAASKVKA